MFSEKGLRWLEKQELLQPYAQSLGNHLTHFQFVHQEVEQATEQLLGAETDTRTLTLLLSILGIGDLDGTNAAGRDRNHSPIPASREVD